MLCKRPFYRSITFILYFVSLPLTSPSFCYFLDYSTHFHSLPFTSYFGLSYLRMFLTILVFVMFYLHTISDSRMFVVTILTWSIRNTGSVFEVFWFVVLPILTKTNMLQKLFISWYFTCYLYPTKIIINLLTASDFSNLDKWCFVILPYGGRPWLDKLQKNKLAKVK